MGIVARSALPPYFVVWRINLFSFHHLWSRGASLLIFYLKPTASRRARSEGLAGINKPVIWGLMKHRSKLLPVETSPVCRHFVPSLSHVAVFQKTVIEIIPRLAFPLPSLGSLRTGRFE